MIITQKPNDIIASYLEKQNYSSYFILTDSNTYTKCMPVIAESLSKYDFQTLTIPAGENTKKQKRRHRG